MSIAQKPFVAIFGNMLQGRSQKKLVTEAMFMEDLWPRQSVHGWVLFLGMKSVNDYKQQLDVTGELACSWYNSPKKKQVCPSCEDHDYIESKCKWQSRLLRD